MEKITQREFILMLTQNAYKKDIPIQGSFELTPLCNLDCKMCYVHLQDASVADRMLSGEQWIAIMKDAVQHGMTTILLTGGEAMTHPDFWKIYEFLVHSGVKIYVKSNGILLNKETVNHFLKFPPDHIDISLYGCDSESYLAVTGRDVFELVTENIQRTIDAGIRVRLAITPSAYMRPWTESIMKYAKSFGCKVIVNSLLIDAGEECSCTVRKQATENKR